MGTAATLDFENRRPTRASPNIRNAAGGPNTGSLTKLFQRVIQSTGNRIIAGCILIKCHGGPRGEAVRHRQPNERFVGFGGFKDRLGSRLIRVVPSLDVLNRMALQRIELGGRDVSTEGAEARRAEKNAARLTAKEGPMFNSP